MEPRHKAECTNPTRRLNQPISAEPDPVVPPLPHIADLIAEGEITIGYVRPLGCVAVATDGHNCRAMLRRQGETLAELLTRLDQAIAPALNEDVYTEEINAQS